MNFSLIGGESKDPAAVYSAIKERIERARAEGIDKNDIERTKKVMKASGIKMFNYIEGMGNAYIRMLMKGINPLEYNKIIDSLGYEDIMERLRAHIDTGNCVLSTILPAETGGAEAV